jgi:hypothetical protein
MGRRLPRAAVVAVCVIVTVVGSAVATSAAPLPANTRVGHVVTLLTGERVMLSRGLRDVPTAAIVRTADSGPAAQLKVVTLHGHTYVIPASAMAYLGRTLDPELFDVTAMQRAGYEDRVPLIITFKPGTKPSLPGVTFTKIGAGTARAYVTQNSARTFGAALADQSIADSQAGWPATDALFGSVTGIAPAFSGPTGVSPHFAQTTLIIDGISKSGGPMRFAFGIVVNADDARKFGGFVVMLRGQARASVPLGTYDALFDDFSFDVDGSATVRENVVTDFAVTGTQGHMVIDSRDATATPSLTTPKPSIVQDLSTTVTIVDATHHSSFGWGWGLGNDASIRFTPTPPPTVGTLRLDTRWLRIDPSTPGGAYEYDASFSDQGIPADQARSLGSPASALTVDSTYAATDPLGLGGAGRFVFVPHSNFAEAMLFLTPFPLHRVEYVYAPQGSTVENLALADAFAPDPGFMDGRFVRFTPGTTMQEHWFGQPYRLGVPPVDPMARFTACFACISPRRMVFLSNLSDSDPLHSAELFGGRRPVARFTVYRDGVQVLHRDNSLGAVFKIPDGDATYRFLQTVSRFNQRATLSTVLKTDVTVHSELATPAPKNMFCFSGKPCSVLPAPTALLDLHPTDRGALTVGVHDFDLAVGHIVGATSFPFSKVAVSVRRTGTSTWTPLTMTSTGSGSYQARFKAMAWMVHRDFDVQVRAIDDQGNAIVQTVLRAFVVES